MDNSITPQKHPKDSSDAALDAALSHDASLGSPPSSPARSESSSSISPHYDDKRDVVATIECLSDSATKRISMAIWAATAIGLGLLLAGLILNITKVHRNFTFPEL